MKKVIIANVRVANNWLDIIDTCDMNINADIHPDYFQGVKIEAEEKFCTAVKELCENFMLCSKDVPTLAYHENIEA